MRLSEFEINSVLEEGDDILPASRVTKSPVSETDIAVIGMSGKIADADNLESFWRNLIAERSSVRTLPDARKHDVENYLKLHHALDETAEQTYLEEAYLNDVDKFDYRFFGISRQEANLMDPDQRLFLETAWAAIEEAGYGGSAIEGSKTGVFVGLSNDFGEDYRKIINTYAPDAPEISIVGNIKSVIASRIAYHLDLKGPSLVVDTACSSALVALHLACKSIRNGESDMALAGTVKTHLIPIHENSKRGVGLKDINDTFAQDYRTKTFDESSDGMSIGEGVMVFMLKRLSSAIEDKDNIHCVIKGSAINQDGKTVGLTAPSNHAQAEAIVEAHRDAKISPHLISYIEAHGTGTKLGDPVEISGINRAFRKNTQRKQFCGVGSVKTNIGHLDNAAGLASFAKVALSMKYEMLPASLNFTIPNTKIAFHDSPVYVVDRTTEWSPDDESPLYAGINSFGLSGTNCHVVVQSFGSKKNRDQNEVFDCDQNQTGEAYLLTLSAKTPEALVRLGERYRHYLFGNIFSQNELYNMCSTAYYGRWHYDHRAILIFSDFSDLCTALDQYLRHGGVRQLVEGPGVKVLEQQGVEKVSQVSSARVQAQTYCKGGNVDWADLYASRPYQKISLPTYPFVRDRCWVELTEAGKELQQATSSPNSRQHPLLHRMLAETQDLKLFESRLGPALNWELAEHVVRGRYVLPGTCYIDIMLESLSDQNSTSDIHWKFQNIQFLSPFVVDNADSTKELHTKLTNIGSITKIEILSRGAQGKWSVHVTAEVENPNVREYRYREQRKKIRDATAPSETVAVEEKLLAENNLCVPVEYTKEHAEERGLFVSDRWIRCFESGYTNPATDRFLFKFSLPETYSEELQNYNYHPALFDCVINAANHLIGRGELYLPLSYHGMKVSGKLPQNVFVYLRLLNSSDSEVVQFEIRVYDPLGTICTQIEKYSVKRVADGQTLELESQKLEIFGSEQTAHPLNDLWTQDAGSVVNVRLLYIHNNCLADLVDMKALESAGYALQPIPMDRFLDSAYCMKKSLSLGNNTVTVVSARQFDSVRGSDIENLTKTFQVLQKLTRSGSLAGRNVVVLTRCAYSGAVDVCPTQSAISVMSQVAALENPDINLLTIDVDELKAEYLPRTLSFADRYELSDSLFVIRSGAIVEECQKSVSSVQKADLPLEAHGVYLLTGGTGALGRALAARLAVYAKSISVPVKIVLAGRQTGSRAIPAHESDERRNTSHYTELMTQIAAMTNPYAEISYLNLDLTNGKNLSSQLADIRSRLGPIKGIVHAAGCAGDGFLRNKSPESIQQVLNPKCVGLALLDSLTLADSVDFFIAYSSVSSIALEAGQADYAAANRYMDTVMLNRRSRGKVGLSIRWPAWSECGMALDKDAVRFDEFFEPIESEPAVDALFSCIAHQNDLPPVITVGRLSSVSSAETAASCQINLSEDLALRLQKAGESVVTDRDSKVKEVDLQDMEAPDRVMQQLGNVWGRVLMQGSFSIYESFTDLGGNSILTAQLYKELSNIWPGALDMADLFTHTTIHAQTTHLKKSINLQLIRPEDITTEDVDQQEVATTDQVILDMLASGEMSLEEAQAII